jgi:site-specific recombinase XerD
LTDAQIRVRGKGNKTRFLPLAPEAAQLLDHYLRLERPTTAANALFVSLKGPARGARMTPAGLRSLFRHHRRTTGVKIANPHRFRHTFASDMVRAGVSLPALMQLWDMRRSRPPSSICRSRLWRSTSNMRARSLSSSDLYR